MKVTACLISWKRPDNLGKIIASLHQWDFIDEILIHVNKPGNNVINYGRYLMAEKARNDLIYVQDDDHIINNVNDIYEAFVNHPTRIANGGIEDYLKVVPDNIFLPVHNVSTNKITYLTLREVGEESVGHPIWETLPKTTFHGVDVLTSYLKGIQDIPQMAMVGFGSMFNKQWYQEPLSKYIQKYGMDYCFYRETDRIFTMLMNKTHIMVPVEVEVLPGARDENALSSQEDHLYYKNLAIERCKEILNG